MARFVLNETSYHGKGSIAEIANEIKARQFKKAFVCSDPDLIKFGVTKKVTDVLDAAAIDYVINNPEDCERIVARNVEEAKLYSKERVRAEYAAIYEEVLK